VNDRNCLAYIEPASFFLSERSLEGNENFRPLKYSILLENTCVSHYIPSVKIGLVVLFIVVYWALPGCVAQESLVDSLAASLKVATSNSDKIRLLNALAYELCYVNADSAIRLSETSLQLASKENDAKGKADALNNLGIANHIRGNFPVALNHYSSSLLLRREQNDSAGVAGLLNNMASIYAVQGNYPEALDNYQQSLELKLKLGNEKGAANSLNNIGNIYYYQKNYDLSLQYYERALDIENKIGNTMGLGRSLGNVGLIYLETGRLNDALQNYLLAYQKMDSLKLECQKMYPANGLGQTYYQLGKLEAAHQYLDEAYSEAVACNDPVIISSSLETLGKISVFNKQYTLAEKRLAESYDVAKANDLKVQVKDASKSLYEFYKSRGNIGQALSFLEINKSVTDSLLNEDLTEQLTRMEVNYQFKEEKDSLQFAREKELLSYNSDIKRRELIQVSTFVGLGLAFVLLFVIYRFYRVKQKANEQLSVKNEIISRTLREKEMVLKEIHHRVKNNLQIVSSLLSIQSRMVKDAAAREAIRDSQSRVHSMSLVHQNLYSGGDVSEVSADRYLEQLIKTVCKSFDPGGQCQLNLNLDPVVLPPDTAMNLGLISNEIITNAFKHAFSGSKNSNAVISVSLTAENDNISLCIADNGIGAENPNQSFGTQLIDALVRSIKGIVTIDAKSGTSFTIKLPQPNGQAVYS
jgi:two-component system, sensor histidine kinase PdtaS